MPRTSTSRARCIRCHAYWRLKGLVVDLVIWNEDHVGYRQRLQDQIMGLIATGSEATRSTGPGGIFVRSAEQISNEDRMLLQAVGPRHHHRQPRNPRWSRSSRRGARGQERCRDCRRPRAAIASSPRPRRTRRAPDLDARQSPRRIHADGSEYVITTTQSQMTPRRGSTCSRIRASARSSRRAAAPTPGARTPMNSA